MFGSNMFGQPMFGQGAASIGTLILSIVRSYTRAIAGFARYTRRIT